MNIFVYCCLPAPFALCGLSHFPLWQWNVFYPPWVERKGGIMGVYIITKQEPDWKGNFYNYIKVKEFKPLKEILTVSNRKRIVFITGSYYFCLEVGREQVHSVGAWSPSSGPSFATGCETAGKLLCLSGLSLQSVNQRWGGVVGGGVSSGNKQGVKGVLVWILALPQVSCQNPFWASIFSPLKWG